MKKKKKLPLGNSDFKDIVSGNYYYVDKTLFIQDIIDKGSKVLLVPRPRRFGKTLNLSMVKYFYDCCPEKVSLNSEGLYPSNKTDLPKNSYKELFKKFKISNADEEYTDKMGKHPVIFISFRNIKDNDWETCLSKIKYLIKNEYLKHSYLLESQELKPAEKDFFKKIINSEGDKGDYENSLEVLLSFLSRYYEERTVILIDEYDAPVHSGFINNYYDTIIDFMRNFLGGGLKDTDQYLEKAIITGILRIAKESIFSGLNNVSVFSLTSNEFNDKFGFTENEVETILNDFNLIDRYDEIKEWYNGYRFGDEIIYNPWSILSFLENIDHEVLPYWINTAKNDLIDNILTNGGSELKEELEQLIKGEYIEKIVDENIIMKEIDTQESFLWSFLLMTGYLKQISKRIDPLIQKYRYTLSIPNLEVKSAYINIINRYFSSKITNKKLEIMLKALIDGDIIQFEEILQEIVLSIFSFHDFSGEPEKVFHALVTGLLIWISNTHEIKSNRESGLGRYDIVIIPKDTSKTGYVIEFKSVNKRKKETVFTATEAALKQIEEKEYDTELIERDIRNIKKLAIILHGKNIIVKEKQTV